MAQFRVRSFVTVLAIGTLAVAGCSSSSKTASSNSSSTSSSSNGGGLTVPSSSGGATVNVTVGDTAGTDGPETLVPASASAAAGDITFTVKNSGTIDHEMVVLKTDTAFDKLAVGTSEPDKIDEASSIGETGDPALKPGESRTFTLKAVTAGNYVLVCNIAKHYALGMRAAFKVS